MSDCGGEDRVGSMKMPNSEHGGTIFAGSCTAFSSPQARPKQLMFDRRYGWVYDEWVDPSEHAYVGSRGLFCIVPLTISAVNAAFFAANVAAALVVQSIQNRSEVVPQVRRQWRRARLQVEQFRERVEDVSFLRKDSVQIIYAGFEARMQRQPEVECCLRFSKDLADRGKALGTDMLDGFHQGLYFLHQGLHDRSTWANQQLQQSSERAVAITAQACQHVHRSMRILPELKARGVAIGSGPVKYVHSRAVKVVARSRSFGDQVTRQSRDCLQKLPFVCKDLSSYAVHQIRSLAEMVSHHAKVVGERGMSLRDHLGKSEQPLSSGLQRVSRRWTEIQEVDLDDRLLATSRLLTMVAAADEEEHVVAESSVSRPSLKTSVASRSSKTFVKRTRKRLRKVRG